MTKLKYDVTDVDAGGGGGEQPPVGVHDGKIASMTHRDKKADGSPTDDLEVIVDFGTNYARVWSYVQLGDGPAAWKLRQLTDALGLPPKGTIDTDKHKGAPIRCRIVSDNDLDGNYKASIKNFLAPGETGANGAAPAGEATEFDEWTDEDLKAELEEKGLSVSGRWSRQKAVDLLSEGSENGAEPAVADRRDEYESWSLEDLQAEAEERGIAGNVTGRKTKDKYVEALLATDDGPAGETEPDAPEDDYDDWSLDELKDEIDTRNKELDDDNKIVVEGRVTKEKAIAALREDDKEPF